MIFGFFAQKTLPVPIFRVLASLEVILYTKKIHNVTILRPFTTYVKSLKCNILETTWGYKLKFSGLSSFYDTNNWGKFEDNLSGRGDIFYFFWMI